jgi:hypothetical protein
MLNERATSVPVITDVSNTKDVLEQSQYGLLLDI